MGTSTAKGLDERNWSERPQGVTSRLRPAPKQQRHRWSTAHGDVELPVIVDHVGIEAGSPPQSWWIEATVDLVNGRVSLTQLTFEFSNGADVESLQANFRWSTPVEIVENLIPHFLSQGIDPFTVELATSGFPKAARPGSTRKRDLSDEFLKSIVERYLAIGRGYAAVVAIEHGVSQRTVISWIEKARKRQLLTSEGRGKVGGQLVEVTKRTAQS